MKIKIDFPKTSGPKRKAISSNGRRVNSLNFHALPIFRAAVVSFALLAVHDCLFAQSKSNEKTLKDISSDKNKSHTGMTPKSSEFEAEAATYKKLAKAAEKYAEATAALKQAADERRALLNVISWSRPFSPSPAQLKAEADNFNELAAAAQKCAEAAALVETAQAENNDMTKSKAVMDLRNAVERKKALAKILR